MTPQQKREFLKCLDEWQKRIMRAAKEPGRDSLFKDRAIQVCDLIRTLYADEPEAEERYKSYVGGGAFVRCDRSSAKVLRKAHKRQLLERLEQ